MKGSPPGHDVMETVPSVAVTVTLDMEGQE